MKSVGEGIIVCTINYDTVPAQVSGVGMVAADWTGNAGECIYKGRSKFKVSYEGEIITGEDNIQHLEMKKTSRTDLGGQFTISCAGVVQEVPGSCPIPMQEDDRVIIFDLEQGATNSYNVPGTDTQYSYKLDLRCK